MKLNSLCIAVLIALVAIGVAARDCMAQNRNMMGQTSGAGFGQSAMGASAFGQGGQAGRGQSRAGAGYGTGAFGAAGQGSRFGATAGGTAFGNNQLGVAGQDGFIGNDAAQSQNFFRNMNGGQRRAAAFDFMIENLNEMRDRGNQGGNDRAPPVRVKLRPAFETSLGTMQQVSSELQSRLTVSVADLGVADSRISLDGRTILLEGKVTTEHQRALVEKMVSLEPGVDTIDNRLIVEPTAAKEE